MERSRLAASPLLSAHLLFAAVCVIAIFSLTFIATGFGSAGRPRAASLIDSAIPDTAACSLEADLDRFREGNLLPLIKTNTSSSQQFHCVRASSPPVAVRGCGDCSGPPSVAFLFLVKNNVPLAALWEEWLALSMDRRRFTVYLHIQEGTGASEPPSSLRGAISVERVKTSYGNFVLAENALLKAALRDPCNQMMVLVTVSHIPVSHPDVAYDVLFQHRVPETGGQPTSRFCYAKAKPFERSTHKGMGNMDLDRTPADTASPSPSCQDAESTIGYDLKHHQWRAWNRYHASIVVAQGLTYPYDGLPWNRGHGPYADPSEWFGHHVLRRALGNGAVWKQVNGGLQTNHTDRCDDKILTEFCDTKTCWSADACGYGMGRSCSPSGPLCFSSLNLTKLTETISSRHPLFFRKVPPDATLFDEGGREVGRVTDLLIPLIRNYSRPVLVTSI
ncbi:unnamed protein product [Vitrella brassicaformis CCMP3155]|uniref:Uncharacterized protein n=1 Tax=Vitrella brassicaformis (strain CCMP3155) TaxID=1169540 RepID=A0A0G4EAH8_VITBC|nr:unnamed protein product [Vitrella brassicaformis CCMP3155]|eukprot:CEL92249.1 unnamed protein product [Vitrella brassicaformis CCMP3155]